MGLIMLAMFVAYMVCNVLADEKRPRRGTRGRGGGRLLSKTLGLLVVGAVLIAVGANLLVDNGTLIAQALGVPETSSR